MLIIRNFHHFPKPSNSPQTLLLSIDGSDAYTTENRSFWWVKLPPFPSLCLHIFCICTPPYFFVFRQCWSSSKLITSICALYLFLETLIFSHCTFSSIFKVLLFLFSLIHFITVYTLLKFTNLKIILSLVQPLALSVTLFYFFFPLRLWKGRSWLSIHFPFSNSWAIWFLTPLHG